METVKHKRKYRQLTPEDRAALSVYIGMNCSVSETANRMGVHRSTIYRELSRNSDSRCTKTLKYTPHLAGNKSKSRKQSRQYSIRFTPEMKELVKEYILHYEYSPEQIVGRCKLEYMAMVSHETIYKWIWEEKKKGYPELSEHLRHKGRKYGRRGNKYHSRGMLKDCVSIEQRDAEVEERQRFGDIEADTVMGKNNRGALMTLVDRCTRMVWIKKLPGKEAEALADAAISVLSPWKSMLHTITSDNGKEFAGHLKIKETLGIEFYFAHPYHSWERGTNENTNGLIRQYIPKGMNFEDLTDEQIKDVEWKLNHRPRKVLNFLTPLEVYKNLSTFVALTT